MQQNSSSVLGSGYWLIFSRGFTVTLKSPQILTALDGLGTTTIGVAHSEYSTLCRTLLCICLFRSRSTAGLIENGISRDLQNFLVEHLPWVSSVSLTCDRGPVHPGNSISIRRQEHCSCCELGTCDKSHSSPALEHQSKCNLTGFVCYLWRQQQTSWQTSPDI